MIDVSDPADLRLLGAYRSAAEPFEMYVEDGRVFALFNAWYSYECDASSVCNWQTTSRMQALDVRAPEEPRLLADVVVPGTISDSRRVGDVLDLATSESGYCWGCESQPSTTLTSFNVADLTWTCPSGKSRDTCSLRRAPGHPARALSGARSAR